MLTKIVCQLPSSISRLPMPGANTGTMMKTIMAKDITRAISRPPWQSRTMATASTRAAAIPAPWIARATSNTVKLSATRASRLPTA